MVRYPVGTRVGITQPNLYTGVGVVKESDIGIITEYPEGLPNSVYVDFLSKGNFYNPRGRMLLLIEDLEKR